MATLSEENYLKAIFHLANDDDAAVSTNAIARKMETKASSATDMIQKLFEKGLIDYQKYKGVKLTENGRLAAVSVIRKHRLWEVFLVDKLRFSWDEVHEVAEQLEHIKSKKLISELDAFLEFPKEDPHGDPIPDHKGNMPYSKKLLLAKVKRSQRCICIGVKDSTRKFLQYLDKYKIALGTEITVLSRESYDESMEVKVNNIKRSISKEVAHNLYVIIS
ncbi:MAG: metal-dependent transcriptional regulator [Flavobacteriaceae bacterium]|tara:strand:- start:458 stop:1114 length:657 start_codon:yes stop_codon:yes gene_type:complete